MPSTRFTIIFDKLAEHELEQPEAAEDQHDRTLIKYEDNHSELDEIYELVRLADAMEEPDIRTYTST